MYHFTFTFRKYTTLEHEIITFTKVWSVKMTKCENVLYNLLHEEVNMGM